MAVFVACVACGVGEVVILLGDVALLAVGEVVETVDDMDDEDDFAGLEDGLVVASFEEEASLEDAASDGPTLLLGSSPQVFGSVRALNRSCISPEQKASIECSSGAFIKSSRQSLKPQSPLSKG